MNALLLILVLAAIVEGLVEYLGAPVPPSLKSPAAAVLGVVLCIVYGADLLALAGFPAIYPVAGQVLTGVLIGRGSNFINDLWSRFLAPAPPAADRLAALATGLAKLADAAKQTSGPRQNWPGRPLRDAQPVKVAVDPVSTAPSEAFKGFRDFPDRGDQ
jgi:hypothetical protein